MSAFEPVDPKVSFPKLEEEILDFWREADVFAKSLELRKDAPEWVFYEGPPTANGVPGIHHVEPRTFKDVYPRFKTMTGYSVPRKAGWDCHGLPVELEIEKEIGTKTKSDIEAFGIGEFTRLCRESVTRYVGDFERLTDRIGFWIDMSDAYWTMDTEYVESVWWSLKQLWQRGLLVEDHKVTAYCPRCGTALSDAEVAQGYRETEDPSVVLMLEILDAPDGTLVGTRIAVWTTTPWTLISNMGLAVSEAATYTEVRQDDRLVLVAEPLRAEVFPEAPATGRTWKGADLVGARYEPPYANADEGSTHTIVAADFVSMEDGTGVVHIAPAFGADDLEVGRIFGWPMFNPVDAEGRFTTAAVPEFVRGLFVKDADPLIVEDLRSRGLLLKAETYTHSYPFCWRCSTPLLYYARTSWYIRTTEVKDRLLQVNRGVGWFPEHIRDGRFGNWLENNVDWALSRDRYWGTPLPVWRCASKHTTVISSLNELSDLTGRDCSAVDPHRPAIDEVTFSCPECGQEMTRASEVTDTWYDSGAMPFAQWGYHPELGRGEEMFEKRFPADFICEAIDQTRGWFYTLMAEGVLHFDSTTYRNVVCLGHLVDADGRKMSKSLGNAIDPWDVLNRQGADTLRWFLLTSGSPWSSRRISMDVLDDIVRQFMLTLWNVYSFFVTYANADGFDPTVLDIPLAERPLLDRWALSRLAATVRSARDGLDGYDVTGAGREIARFVDDLSNWYVRRSRRRFWDPAGEANAADKTSAYQTLHSCLATVSQLLAPFIPFTSEALWLNLAAGRGGAPASVHLSDYPEADPSAIDPSLDAAMAAARGIVALGRTIRNDERVKVRQPLLEAVVHYPGDHDALRPLLSVVAEELNVKEVLFAESAEQLAGWRAKPNFKVLGPKLGPRVKDLAEALAQDDGRVAGALARGEAASVVVAGTTVLLDPGDVDLTQETREGWGVSAESGLTVALDLELTDELRLEGMARDIVRIVQDTRRAAGLDISDRIDLGIEATAGVQQAVDAHADYIKRETLALTLVAGPVGSEHSQDATVGDDPVRVTLRRAAEVD